MNKTEPLSTYTVEQLAEMVERLEKYSEINEIAKNKVGGKIKTD